MGPFQKICNKCGVSYEGTRNARVCKNCYRKYCPRIRKEKLSKFPLDKEFLESNSELLSYFIGFLFSDGTMSANKEEKIAYVGFYSTDKHIIEDLTSRLRYSRPIFIAAKKEGYDPVYGNLFFADNARYFLKWGLRPDKDNLEWNPSLGLSLFDFLRGFFDGDGSIVLRESSQGGLLSTVSFLGRFKLISSIKNALELEGFKPCLGKPRQRNGGKVLYQLYFGGRQGLRLLQSMYKNSTIHLIRKHKKYQVILETMRNLQDQYPWLLKRGDNFQQVSVSSI